MGKHSALEDATTTMELYLLLREEWEQTDEPFLLPPNQIRQVLHEDEHQNGAIRRRFLERDQTSVQNLTP